MIEGGKEEDDDDSLVDSIKGDNLYIETNGRYKIGMN